MVLDGATMSHDYHSTLNRSVVYICTVFLEYRHTHHRVLVLEEGSSIQFDWYLNAIATRAQIAQ